MRRKGEKISDNVEAPAERVKKKGKLRRRIGGEVELISIHKKRQRECHQVGKGSFGLSVE